jgi:apolipoprotein N-acyltransferase
VKGEGARRKARRGIAFFSSSFVFHPSFLAFALGALTVAGFAPFRLFPLPVITLAALIALFARAPSPRAAAAIGYAWGLGLFLAGVSWVYVSLHDFGAMSAPLAALATLLFCAYLAAYPALAGYLYARIPSPAAVKAALVLPACWTLLEWARGWLLTGFPWLALGYSQIPASPLAGYAPVLGIYGVCLATAASAGLLAVLASHSTGKDQGAGRRTERTMSAGSGFRLILHPSSFILVVIWLSGWGLKHVEWTEPQGEPVSVSLLQGNVPQDLKWRPERIQATLQNYGRLAVSSRSRLIILPETALPLFLDEVPREYLAALAEHARRNAADLLIGVPERLSDGRYYNSVISLGTAETQSYRKVHLVPFGEFIPLRPLLGWIVSVLSIPLQDFSRGDVDQRPLKLSGQRIAVNICYEDAFGEEIIRQLPEATLLVNVSNVAWFGRSIAPQQHLQISQARALETGRYMLRATNTGVTAVIDSRGHVVRAAPEFTRAIVTHEVPGLAGATPYTRMGNSAVLALCAVLLVAAGSARGRR